MKVLVFASEFPPEDSSGIGNFVINLSRTLGKLGIECRICTPSGPHERVGYPALIRKWGIGGLLHYWQEVGLRYSERAKSYDLVWLHNPLLFRKGLFESSFVTVHTTYDGAIPLNAKRLLYNKLASRIERTCYLRLHERTRFAGVSPEVCMELERIGIPKGRTRYIQTGVDPSLFKPAPDKRATRRRLNLPENDLIVLSLGRIVEVKQPLHLIRVFSEVQKAIGNATLVIAGRGTMEESAKKLANKICPGKVRFLGYVSNEMLPDVYGCSDYFAMASKYEGQPATLLEAMSSGLGCIVSNIPNLKIVEEAKCGVVVDFESEAKAALDIVDYLQTDKGANSQSARHYAITHHDWNVVAKEYEKEFRLTIARGGD